MHAESIGHHALHKIDTMCTNRRKERQPRNSRKRETINRPEQRTGTLHFRFIVLFILLLPTVFSRVGSAERKGGEGAESKHVMGYYKR